jgi:hypothetical protein
VIRFATLALVLIGQSFHPTPAAANSFPGWANSHYVSYSTSLTTQYFYNRGCETGNSTKYRGGGGTNVVVVLDFGTPSVSGSTYGARLWSGTTGQFESTTWIADRVKQFGNGFFVCSPANELLTILVGVNSDNGTLSAAHGTAWGNMVDSINAWFTGAIAEQVWSMGAIDIESGFAASVSKAKAWVNAYSTATDSSFVYNFGAASGCPTDASYTSVPGYRCSGSSGCVATTAHCFYQDDLWYLSWGCTLCRSIPEIYNTTIKTLPNGASSDSNAQQWEGLRRYAWFKKGNDDMFLSGSTTQYTACVVQGRSCSGTNNSQVTGWTHLHNSIGAYTPVETILPWSTDFMWGW